MVYYIWGDILKNITKRINELAHKSKTSGLTHLEKEEQKNLREEYIKKFRNSLKNTLLNTKIVDPMGNDLTPDKLKKEQNKKKN